MKIGFIGKHGRPSTRDGNRITKNKVLTEDGNLILDKREEILDLYEGNMYVRNKWGDSWFENVFEGQLGIGYTFITNRRIFHYRTRDPVKVLGDMLVSGTFQAPEKTANILTAKSAKRKGVSDYCEIPLDEIVKMEIWHRVEWRLNELGRGPITKADIDIIFGGETFRYSGRSLESKQIEKVLADKEITRTVIRRGLLKFTVVWYQNPEELEFNKPSYKRKFVKMFNKHCRK